MRLKDKELDGVSFPDLVSLEIQLNESLHRVKDQKTQILLNQTERSSLQEKRALEENQILRKQVEMLGRSSGPKFVRSSRIPPTQKPSMPSAKPRFYCGTQSLRVLLLALAFVQVATTYALTIKSSANEDVDCIDKLRQPAFDNDLLKNHRFQEFPSEFPRVTGTTQTKKIQTFEAGVSTANCPEGTVPIRSKNGTANHPIKSDDSKYHPGHEYAVISTTDTTPELYGTKASINVWDPTIEDGAKEMSVSQIWIASGQYRSDDLNTIEIGWQVLPSLYKDNKPRLFLFWTDNGYRTGCYNVRCPGFIQTSSSIVVGGPISPISSYGGSQYEISIQVWKDQLYGNWWLSLGPNNILVGYWPGELFTTLADHASMVQWGGEIVNRHQWGRHTTTQMGSGHFPDEGFGRSCYFRNLEVVDKNNSLQSIPELKRIVTNPGSYNVKDLYTDEWKTHFFYGGPGFRPHSGAVPSTLGSILYYLFFSFFLLV